MAKKIKWGILGCGGIARKFASDLPLTKQGELVAVGSRSKRKAETFAKSTGAVRAYGSYEQLVQDPDIDVVYVATPHPMHMENSILAMRAGKAVLCEKPAALNAKQLRRMIRTAEQNDVFLMEAMWTRFFPAIIKVRRWLAENRIGKVYAMEANFGIHFRVGPTHRIYNPDLGGGALLDLGIYPVSFASMVYGQQPKKIVSTVHRAKTGVDEESSIIFDYSSGSRATLGCSSRVTMKNEARIYGSQGMLTLGRNFHHPDRLTLQMEGKNEKIHDFEYPGNGYQFEAEHVHTCLQKNMRQSDMMPLSESLAIMQTMDRIRKQWKLKYPNE
jgi:predicted dehydrogenase